ncbi:MAG: carbamoyltransferase [Pseudomonadota bacterium]
MNILGISAYYHDSAAALVCEGRITAAAQEERFTRRKHDPDFPRHAIAFCLNQARLELRDLDFVVFYDKPLLTFERLLETYLASAPCGLRSFLQAMPVWLKEKLYLKKVLRDELGALGGAASRSLPPLLFTEHHQSHAASAFFPSPFESAAVLCMDGVGEWATTSIHHGKDHSLYPCRQLDFPHSLGLLYSAFTYQAGFKVNSGEYKLMGLAPYGSPVYREKILDHLLDLKSDGSFRLDLDYFAFPTGLRMTNEAFDALFDGPPREPEAPITRREIDLARSIQEVTEEIVLRLAATAQAETGERRLCLAGGVALNCVANGRLLREGPFDDVWIQPAAGDAGGALGAALAVWHQYADRPRQPQTPDAMAGALLGPKYPDNEIEEQLARVSATYERLEEDELLSRVASLLAGENVVGWMQGPMEFGPRALGARSILGDARSARMQSVMNLKIKFRESFRPFAPAVLAEDAEEYFELVGSSPYMLQVADVRKEFRREASADDLDREGLDRLKTLRSDFPAITHVDYSARVQTVSAGQNPRFHALLTHFKDLTGHGMLVNTSFNVRGEPIVRTPEDAYRCFVNTEKDYLVIENFLLKREDQPSALRDQDWVSSFERD